VPAAAGPACLREILDTIRSRRIPVVFPIEYRYVRADDAWLSMFGARDGCSISIHQFHDLDYAPYFDAIEPIFWKYEGRPHWGKLHTLGSERLARLYPRWSDFQAVRRELDPRGRMLNDHLRYVLGA
jgi:FAD/FMN-containing dehydrogenase